LSDGGGWERVRQVPFPELTDEQLVAICDRHGLPRGPFGRLPETGVVNAIFTIADVAVLRIPKDLPGCLRDTWTESVAVPAAMASGVRTPALLAFDASCDVVGVPFTVFEWVHVPHGWPRTDGGWRDLGRQLATVHTGVDVCDDPHGRLDSPGRWTTVDEVLADVGAPLERAVHEALARELRRLEPALEAGGTPRFLHDDIYGPNLLADDRTDEVWLIDWGDAGWGDAALDFRLVPPDHTPMVLEGYREVANIDDGFEDRVRWDQLAATVRRVAEPAFVVRLQKMLGDEREHGGVGSTESRLPVAAPDAQTGG
jgi:aminoglycoside phosphotransferase (APT) family kinase protein